VAREVHGQQGWFNEDFASATFDDGMGMLATGAGVHYPMLSGTIGTLLQNYPDSVNDIGAFALPAQNADDTTLTVWPPNAWFIPKTTEGDHLTAAEKFLAFVNSPDGCAVQNEFGVPSGPYVISTCTLPDDVAPLLLDLQAYFDADNSAPALEFVSPVKGPNLEFITVEVGSGIRSAEDGAALYDEDVKKQAQQLGLEGW
jgi:raffinose/stachyose/melibiose transport system substrate-binding protein